MAQEKSFKVIVTQLKISKPFLKVFVKGLHEKYYPLLCQLEEDFNRKPQENVKLGEMYIAMIDADKYERCRVIQVNENDALISCMDCGYSGVLSHDKVRRLHRIE
jgi:hypothetical protein